MLFVTEPKFINISHPRKLLSLIQEYELKFRPDSPITQKAIESMGQDRHHFRRKNKFELRYDFEIQKIPYSEADLQKTYLNYMRELIMDYQNLFENRKRIKADFEKRQKEEDELRGYKWPESTVNKKFIHNSIEVLKLDQKLQLIEEERNKEQKINDCFAKEAIKQELDRRLHIQDNLNKEEKRLASRKQIFDNLKKKAASENKKVHEKLLTHQQKIKKQLEKDFRASKSIQEKLDAKELSVQQKRTKLISEIATRNRKVDDKINHFKDDFGNRLMDELIKKQQALELSMSKRQKTAEQLEKNRLEKQQFFEQKLNNINLKIKQEREEKESELFNKVGQKLSKSEKLLNEHDKLISKMWQDKKKEQQTRFSKQKERYKLSEGKQQEKIEEWDEKLKSIQDRIEKFQTKKSEEWKNVKEQKIQNQKEHLEFITFMKNKKEDKYQKQYLERQYMIQKKLKKLKDEQEYIRTYQTTSKQRFEQNTLTQIGELVNLKYSSSVQLLNKLKDLEDEDAFNDIQQKYKQIVKVPEKKLYFKGIFKKNISLMRETNDNEFEFQKKYTVQQRLTRHQNIMNIIGQQKALIVVEKYKQSSNQTNNSSQQSWKIFAIDKTINLMVFLHCIKVNVGIAKTTSIFLYCNNQLLPLKEDQTVGSILESQKNKEDNILYIKYQNFETFGFDQYKNDEYKVFNQ
ncbi:unnamed protein product [Paramecium sonneborni]|uniref:Uncharacterized protein n=1 Tax=Paramecium sonneborni TaxID=65129 RepID=A0A8S1R1F6_9CILI|nr:unnamed protein product [Paramecium sonneborni]